MKHLLLGLLLTGCAGVPLERASAAVDKWGDATERLRDFAVDVCREPPKLPPDRCEVLLEIYDVNQTAFAVVSEVVP